MTFTRRTVSRSIVWEGLGLQTGIPVRVELHPGTNGIGFRYGAERVAASPENVTGTRFCTTLGSISTVEHLMSALAGLEVTDAEIELTEPELPALDGSAKEFLDAIARVGLETIGEAQVTGPFSRIFKHDDEGKLALSTGTGHWRYVFRSDDRYPFEQTFETKDVAADYAVQIAPARTFGWEADLPMIEANGLARGLTRESAALLGEKGPLDPLRFADEPARHKLLDAIGDLYLAGVPIRFLNFTGEQTGHQTNIEAARHLALAVRFER